MGKADVVSTGGRKLLAASLLVGASGFALSTPADALELPPISTPPVSVGPVVVSPVQTPPIVVPVPSTVAVGPLVVSTPDATVDPSGGLHVRLPLPSEQGTAPGTVGIDIGPGGSSVSLPPLGGATIEPSLPVDTPASNPPGSGAPPARDRGPDAVHRADRAEAAAGSAATGASDADASGAARTQVVNGDPAGATGSINDAGGGGLGSLLASAAHNKITWFVLIALALVARFVMTWAWRDSVMATTRSRSGGRSATA